MLDLFKGKVFVGACLLLASVGIAQASPATTEQAGSVFDSSQQSQVTVKGIVADALGPVIGANVIEKGTTNGTVTDTNGEFSLTVPSDAVLVVTYIGYVEQQIPVNGQTSINVTLKENTQKLDEVVVVGYGTQKKVNLSGSVSSVNVSELTESRPVTNVSQVLAGMAAGVQVSSTANQPGNNDASISVRGQGTLNTSSPLIIIDGVESAINTVNPQDIESMSVLKDAASAAIYGSRAANGVILITTKQGKKGSLKLEYNGYVSFQSIRNTLEPVSNYADYMELINEGFHNSHPESVLPFSQASIDAWRNDGGKNPLLYPNTNWIKETFQPATAQNHVVSMSGGSDKIRFYTSFGYSNNPGVVENAGYKRYNGRFNIEADVKPWLTLGAQLNGYVADMEPAGDYDGPTVKKSMLDEMFANAAATSPGMVFRAPDGRYGAMNNLEDDPQSANNNPLRRLNYIAGNYRTNNIRARFVGTLKPFKGFSITASYSHEYTDNQRESKPVLIDGWNFQTGTVTWADTRKSSIMNYNGKTERDFGDIVGRYETHLLNDRLGLNVMFGGSEEQYLDKNFSATKYDLIDQSLSVINGAVGDASASGTSTDWAMHSFFGRVNLDWESKYLLEANIRGDASSRFLSNKRWGYFPSVSGAWRMDQEAFMAPLVEKGLSNLKLRLSYGSLGNNAVGNYDALSVYANASSAGTSYNYSLNNLVAMGLAQAALANPELTWESTYVTDAGVDFGFLNNRLTGTVDYFNKKTKNILINLPAPDVHGIADIPKQNSAQVTNKGVELTLGWQDKINDFSYGVNGNFTYVKNNVDKFKGKGVDGQSLSGVNLTWEGHSINSQYLYRVDRIVQTDEDMKQVQQMKDKNPNAFSAFGEPQKGDFLYKDLNNDGVIDSKDREICSDGPNPKYFFGLNLNASYKGFDASVLMQGVAGVKVYWQTAAFNTPTINKGYQLNKEVAEGRWYEGRTDATYPRLLEMSDKRNLQASDFYLQNKAYLKIRNIQLGYTLPKAWTNLLQIERLRIYGSLENFITFTKYKGFDPEVDGMNYPSMKEAVIGLNVTF